jgi:hypothetical protein
MLQRLVKNPAAHWTFQGKDWAQCNRELYKKKLFYHKTFLILGSICLVASFLFPIVPSEGYNTSTVSFFILVIAFGLPGVLWYWSIRRWWKSNSEREGEAYLSSEILWYSPSTMYAWGLRGSLTKLQNIEVFRDEPTRLRFSFMMGTDRNRYSQEVVLPLPPEQFANIDELLMQEDLFFRS